LIGNVKSADPGWYAADPGASCDTACKKLDLVCTIEGLKSHNGDVDSSEELLDLIKNHKWMPRRWNWETIKFDPLAWKVHPDDVFIEKHNCKGVPYGNYPDVPLFSKQTDNDYGRAFCFFSSPNKNKFSCTATPGHADQAKQRVCYCHRAPPVCATVYENRDFQGSSISAYGYSRSKVIHDLWTSDPSWNDRISSVKVNPSCVFKGYRNGHIVEHEQPLVELTEDSNLEGDEDNAISSWICQCGACATVFENHNFQGSSTTAFEGTSGVIYDLWASDRSWNDRVSSVKVNPGCVFKGYMNSHEEQPLVQLTGDSNLEGDYDNAISGWNCQCGVCAAVYENQNFQGSWQYAFPQATSGVIHDLYTSDRWWNDRISSVKVNPGCVFKGYRHTHLEEQPLVELREDSNLEGDENNEISGWTCQCGGGL